MRDMVLPMTLFKLLRGCHWERITIGHSESKTYFLTGAKRNFYLKVQPLTAVEGLFSEKERLEWLKGKLPVPEIVYYERDDVQEYLLLTELKGMNASDSSFGTKLPQLMQQLAVGLRTIHEVNLEGCPFSQKLDVKIEEARRRVEDRLVDEWDFDQQRQGINAEELLNELLVKKPTSEDLVFTHGDYCLPNIVVNGDHLSGFIDWGRAGIADRYQDIALAIRSITYNFGRQHVRRFLEEYGIEQEDASKVHYYQLMDEFF
jgi:aminoglycoside phosphotransferase